MNTLTKQQAHDILFKHIQNINLRRHCLAVGITLRALSEKFDGDPAMWEILGILHDADWEETKDMPDEHTKKTLEWLQEAGIADGPIVHAIKSHNTKRTHLAQVESKMEWALETCDELTGFIVAVALVRPEKTLASVTVESVMKKWNSKEFARAVDRKQIEECKEKLDIPLEEFISITLSAMQGIHEQLGL
jgi:uncharacterized protein